MTTQEPRKRKNNKMSAKAADSQTAARLGPDIRARIGRQLRAMYDDVVSQGVPDRFADLLKNLDAPGSKKEE